MRKIILGRTGAEVSAISLGTWSYGGANKSGKLPVGWAGQSDDDSKLALKRAWELGINHWDTADVYGNGRSEQMIGSMWGSIPRKDIFIATKVGWDRGYQKHWYNIDVMRQNMERSLINLKTDCVDLMYLHHCNFGESEEYFDEAIEVIRKFKEEGKTRYIGLSDWSSKKIMQFIERCDPDVVQPLRNVMDDTYESSELKNYVDNHNLGICFFSPIKHGLLTGKYTMPAQFDDGDFRGHEKAFSDIEFLQKMREYKVMLEDRFADHPNPVMYGVV
ncbi:MAG: aldo/keto reductase, partial [Candidatus Marinimicrobia bacterium]|nr:aldo/keto reductase [Candidatus Neomarinimicrobiota bacterium]